MVPKTKFLFIFTVAYRNREFVSDRSGFFLAKSFKKPYSNIAQGPDHLLHRQVSISRKDYSFESFLEHELGTGHKMLIEL